MYGFMIFTHLFVDAGQQVLTLSGPSAMRWLSSKRDANSCFSECGMAGKYGISSESGGDRFKCLAAVWNNMEGALADGLLVPILRSGLIDQGVAARAESLIKSQNEKYMLPENTGVVVARCVLLLFIGAGSYMLGQKTKA